MQQITFEGLVTELVNWINSLFNRFVRPHPWRSGVITALLLGLFFYISYTYSKKEERQVISTSSEATANERGDNKLLGDPDKPVTRSPTTAPAKPTAVRPMFSPTPTPLVFGDKTVVTPNRIRSGDKFVITANMISPEDGSFKVYVEVYTSGGNKVIDFAKVAQFKRGVPIGFPVDEIVNDNDIPGSFRVAVGMRRTDGGTTVYENQQAATFVVVPSN